MTSGATTNYDHMQDRQVSASSGGRMYSSVPYLLSAKQFPVSAVMTRNEMSAANASNPPKGTGSVPLLDRTFDT